MATVHRLEELNVWKKAREFSGIIFRLTETGALSSDFDHRRQIRRSADSVMDNIAEGFGRGSRGEFIQFLGIAKGSLTESKSQLYRALDRHYIGKDTFDSVYRDADELSGMIVRFIGYLNATTIKGSKYKPLTGVSLLREPEDWSDWTTGD